MQTAHHLPPPPGTPSQISHRFGIPLPRVSGGSVRILESRYEEDLSTSQHGPVSNAPLPISAIRSFVPVRLRVRRLWSMLFKRNPKSVLIV